MKKTYNYFYKITNSINNYFYYGVHSTNNLDDGYMGSGKRLHYAYKKYGIKHFKKEILKHFNSSVDAYIYEANIVNEQLVKDNTCYNITLGGNDTFINNKIIVKDKDENIFQVSADDERFLSGELVHVSKGLVPVKDKDGNIFSVSTTDPRYLSGELVHTSKGLIPVKDKDGNTFSVSITDPKYLFGELVPIWKGKKHSEESKRKIGLAMTKYKGKLCPSYGTCWIYNKSLKLNKKISKTDLDNWINEGWIKGRKYF